ncbi:aldolase catalytic domain-containing protein [Bacillus sp. Marseille-P3661]|uniref:aldolase catalytic domain-containing protein n=1 Tax=Bacillus sp. Marseille-P3661 TaxID=1936234 RepID=UPI000C82B814|nr:aldolase catalytic domain-containing protein [Bacillus sp. Marseille-P3661]
MKNNVKILDCTIRDGGLVNNWEFSIDFVRDVYKALSEAGVDYMEIGYKNSPKLVSTDGVGPWRFCEDEFIKEVIPGKTNTKLSAIVDVGRVEDNDILPCHDSPLDLIRVACYLKDIEKGINLVNTFHEQGYETSINIMAVSNSMEYDLIEALEEINKSPVDIAYIVDSYGSLYNRDIQYLIEKFKNFVPNKLLGIHTHNNLQMAFSNTILASQQGVKFLDTSIFGMGRGAGNCSTELLIGYLSNAKYDVRPILEIIEQLFIPLRNKVEWGFAIPYAITGLLNEHPRSAISHRNSEEKNKFLQFYDKLTNVETQLASK